MSERGEFEAWAKAEGYQIDRAPSQPKLYNWASTQCCWEAWQAARVTQDALQKDAERWRMLPAFLEDYQIPYLGLMRDIDAALANKEQA